jgi:hypothetical protein
MRRADQSSRGVLPSVACLECDSEASIMRRPWPTRGCYVMGENQNIVQWNERITENKGIMGKKGKEHFMF